MSTHFWDETRAEPIDEQLVAEAARAVRDFRTRQLPVMAPASGKLTREMVLKAWNHLYEPQLRLPVHPDEYARMMGEANTLVERHRWMPWYEPPIRDHHEEPPSRPHFVITRLDE